MKLSRSLAAWNTPDFSAVLKAELESVDGSLLPLQQGLARSSHALTEHFSAIVLSAFENGGALRARVGLSYSGIIPGCACTDDPTPMSELPEYCVVELRIDKQTAETEIRLSETD